MAVSVFLVPLQNVPQTFPIPLAGITYNLTCRWNDLVDSGDTGWLLDIADSNDVPLATNIPLITGEDCLSGLEYLGIDGQLFVQTNGSMPLNIPTLDNLGVDSNLYFLTSAPNG